MLKIFKSLLLVSFVFVVTTSNSAITPSPTAPKVAAKSYILQDFSSGRVLVAHDADQRLPPASITKLMTAYVVSHELKAGNITLTDEVLISEKA
ncbi:MAG TPA: D-alanyl-D-alanine carboxypeptidase, partial [Methylophaga sp.]|nr:D-alanyl-D-alanine carboxypeptidase [Methylophaga sp.]